jgi:hypothetical protein
MGWRPSLRCAAAEFEGARTLGVLTISVLSGTIRADVFRVLPWHSLAQVYRVLRAGLDDLDRFIVSIYEYLETREKEASDGTHS